MSSSNVVVHRLAESPFLAPFGLALTKLSVTERSESKSPSKMQS
jgi:hypothetical protein